MTLTRPFFIGVATALGLGGCAQRALDGPAAPLAAARGSALQHCTDLGARLAFSRTVITATEVVPAGKVQVAGRPVPEHCLVTGRMNDRVSPVDGQSYAIGFHMRLPKAWNGRFFHQGNGGLDGFVTDALGLASGGGPVTSALQQGFAVLSSDAGHNVRQLPLFGRDPQARLDYGYQAVGTLTPMALQLVAAAYGRPPDRSYFGGCSNGGRHALVAAARYADQYDGILAGNPGIQLPKAAVAQLYGAQQFASVTTSADLASAFTPAERKLVAGRILARCDALDGLADGIVQDTTACQKAFDLARDVPTCAAGRDGHCLSAAQKSVLARVFSGAPGADNTLLYAPFAYDPGMAASDWASWKFVSSITNRDPVAVAYVFQTPPASPDAAKDPRAFAMNFDIARDGRKIFATDAVYTESAMSFMPPPASDLSTLKRRGGKLMVYHGVADGVFSTEDTTAWYQKLRSGHGGDAANFARLYLVPGMNHCRGGTATDQFDMLAALVDWVEHGRAPDRVVAQARGAGNAVPNTELPASWAPDRSRPLCPYPKVARYRGQGDPERADSFECR